MLDRYATALMQPVVARLATALARLGVKPNAITLVSFVLGLVAAALIVWQHYLSALIVMLLSRLGDALDGAVARLGSPTDAGGFLDISLDFVFYASIPLAFALGSPLIWALPAAVLIASFMANACSFLAFATLAQKRGLVNSAYPNKSFYFIGGLAEASETLIVFTLMCIRPDWFAVLAYGFAVACAGTAAMRIYGGYLLLDDASPGAKHPGSQR